MAAVSSTGVSLLRRIGKLALTGRADHASRWRQPTESLARYTGGRRPACQQSSLGRSLATKAPSSLSPDEPSVEASYDDNERGLFRLLSEDERQILDEQRELLAAVRRLTKDVGLPSPATPLGHGSILEESAFCIVLAGEFNAGKTTILNALLGERLLETGALPTTDAITILSAHPPQGKQSSGSSLVNYQYLPQKRNLLQDLTLVDTPGTNAILLDHTATTLRLLPAADLILFCTSADRPLSESERLLLANMAEDYRKRIVVVINKMDLLQAAGGDHGQDEKQNVIDFVTEHTRTWLGAAPIVLALSARDALAAKVNREGSWEESPLWKRSQFGKLESFLRESLTTKSKIQSKLSNPIGLAEKALDDCLQKLQQEEDDLKTDLSTLQLLESQVKAWQAELRRQMQQSRADIRTSWQQEGRRGEVLLRRLSLWAYFDATLHDTASLRRHWQDTESFQISLTDPAMVRVWIHETAQGLAVRSRAQGQALMEFLGNRPARRQNQSLVGHVLAASRFEQVQETLTQQLEQAVERHLGETKDEDVLLQRLQLTAQLSAGLQAGGLVSALATGIELVDLYVGTGATVALATAGAVVLVQGRQHTVRAYRDAWERRGEALDEDLKLIGDRAMEKVHRRIQDGIAPYTQFVQAEQDRLEKLTTASQDAAVTARRLRNRIDKL
jgi:small GTP-binding protein